MPFQLVLLRAEGQTAADEALCRRFGWQALPHCPLRLIPDVAAQACLPQQWQAADTVFWVSPGAVDAAAPLLARLPEKRHVAVGSATAGRLAQHGLAALYPPQGQDSEAVLALPHWQVPGRLLIVRGHGGRDWLGQQLQQRGWQVAYADIYRRAIQTLDWAPLQSRLATGTLRAVYVTTAGLADAWFAQMPADLCPQLKSLLYLSHHPRVAAALAGHGITRIRTGTLAQFLAASGEESA